MKLYFPRKINLLFSRRNILKIVFVAFVLFTFIVNALHESYPDEFDNILGGWYILHGRLPYIGFFTHHGPVPYFIAAFVAFFSGQSFVHFRLVYALVLTSFLFATYLFLKRQVGEDKLKFYPFFIAFLGIEATYYWMHMLLADNVAALVFLPAYVLILLKTIYRKKMLLIDVVAVSLLSAAMLYSSLTYLYLYFLICLATLYLYFKDNFNSPVFSKKNLYPILILMMPHLIFFLYIIFTGSLSDYIYQNFAFNLDYYIYNYSRPPGSTFINPIRYGILTTHRFLVNFYTLFQGVKTFDFAFPVNITMAVGNVSLFLYLVLKKHYKLSIFLVLILIFTNVRSNPLDSGEKDYQAGIYNLISFFNIIFFLPAIYSSLSENITLGKKVVYSFLLLVLGVYSFFCAFHLLFKFSDKMVPKYMGTAPIIYDRPQIAPVVNKIVSKDEYMWIGPFEFEELFYANGNIPSKYHILIYGIGASDKIRQEMIEDLNKNMPKVIMFDRNFNYLGRNVGSYGQHFLGFLEENYVSVLQYQDGKKKYRSVIPIDGGNKLDIEAKMYLRKDKASEVIKSLLDEKYVYEIMER